MLYCLVKKFIDLNKNEIRDLIKLVFGRKLDKNIYYAFEDAYIEFRYYNYSINRIGIINRKRLVEELKNIANNLTKENPKKEIIIKQIKIVFEYITYFDSISKCKDFESKITKLETIRTKNLGLKNTDFKKEFLETYNKYEIEKSELLKKYENKEFSLKFKQYENQRNLYRGILKSNIKMPKLYSMFAIEKAFNTGIINEDKLIIEYYFVSMQIITDLIKGNFRKHYVLDFADTLLKKPKKLKSILGILNDSAIKEKVSLKITYTEFYNNRDEVYSLINQGYKIIMYLDDFFAVDYSELRIMNLFSYIVINKNLKKYDEIMDNKVLLNNIVEM